MIMIIIWREVLPFFINNSTLHLGMYEPLKAGARDVRRRCIFLRCVIVLLVTLLKRLILC